MAMFAIGTGTAKFGSKTTDAQGKVISTTPPSWTPDENGGSVAIIPLDPESMQPAGPAMVFGDWDAANYLSKILSLLKTNRVTNLPDMKAIFKKALDDGTNLCEYCDEFKCRDCIVNEWKNT